MSIVTVQTGWLLCYLIRAKSSTMKKKCRVSSVTSPFSRSSGSPLGDGKDTSHHSSHTLCKDKKCRKISFLFPEAAEENKEMIRDCSSSLLSLPKIQVSCILRVFSSDRPCKAFDWLHVYKLSIYMKLL